MRNSAGVPFTSLIAAVLLTLLVMYTHGFDTHHLSEMEIGAVAWALALYIYAIQGLISVWSEGKELRPGRVHPHLSDVLTDSIVVLGTLLLVDALALAWGIASGWGAIAIGALAGTGSILLSLLMVVYKEGFLGQEVRFDEREDGVPW